MDKEKTMEKQHLLSVQDLHTSFFTDSGEVHAVNGVSFNLDEGEILGIVGESGSGKSVTAYSIMQILASTGKVTGGRILYKGDDLTRWNEKKLSDFRGKCVSIIFQDPMTSLNPVFTIGNQLMEAITLHTDKRGKDAWNRAVELLSLVGLNEPERRMRQYPHEHSGEHVIQSLGRSDVDPRTVLRGIVPACAFIPVDLCGDDYLAASPGVEDSGIADEYELHDAADCILFHETCRNRSPDRKIDNAYGLPFHLDFIDGAG